MQALMESLTGDFKDEYKLYGGLDPIHKITWTYKDEQLFLNDVQELRRKLGKDFHKTTNWQIQNTSALGMVIEVKTDITLDTYLKRKKQQLPGVENEREEE